MFYKRVVVYLPNEQIYKALKHKVVDDDSTISALVLRLIMQYLNGGDKDLVERRAPCPPAPGEETDEPAEAEFWDKEAKDLDNAMPRHSRPRKGPLIEPVEVSVRAYEKGASKP